MGQRRRTDRSREALGAAEVRGSASAVGGGAHLFVVGPEQADELKDYERLAETSEAFVYVAMTRVMVRRLARS